MGERRIPPTIVFEAGLGNDSSTLRHITGPIFIGGTDRTVELHQLSTQSAKRTTVNVTILNERGEKVFSDVPEEKEDMKLIEGSLGESR